MKTVAELETLIPELIDLVVYGPQNEPDACGIRNESYEEDGWGITIKYSCETVWEYRAGDYWTPDEERFISGHGAVLEIDATYESEDGSELYKFSDSELENVYRALNIALSDF